MKENPAPASPPPPTPRSLIRLTTINFVCTRSHVSVSCFSKSQHSAYALVLNRLFFLFCFFVVQYEDISENDKRVKFLWKALENFTNGKLRLFFFVNVVSAMDVIGKS